MCGRLAQALDDAFIKERYRLMQSPSIQMRYNVAPLSEVLIVRQEDEHQRAAKLFRWGLLPSWAKDPSIASRMINARAETVTEKPAFRNALKRWRCIVPASGFYEWQAVKEHGKTVKQPYYFSPVESDSAFGMAGITERWISPEGEIIHSFAIITTQANSLMESIHDRMPVILPEEEFDAWLDPTNTDPDFLKSFLVPYPSERMRSHAVSREVNKAGPEGERLVQPIDPAGESKLL